MWTEMKMPAPLIPDYQTVTNTSKRRLWKRLAWVVGILVVCGMAIWISGILMPWSKVNCWEELVDITTGRVRTQRFFLYMKVRETIVDSELTKVLEPADLAGKTPKWHRMNTFSPGVRHSPHYTFHGAFGQMRQLHICWDIAKFTPSARRESAKRLLQAWQTGGHDHAADGYLRALGEIAFKRAEFPDSAAVDVGDLPK